MGKDDEDDNIAFNAIVVVESLEDGERKTGRMLHDFINSRHAEGDGGGDGVRATYIPIASRAELQRLIASLVEQATTRGLLPILHIEAHGSEDHGIFFADDSSLDWNSLCDLLAPLNEATGFQLTVVVAACFGESIISGVRLSKPAPCFALLGPTSTITEPELMGVFRDFYSTVLRTHDATQAIGAMKRHTLLSGTMMALTARLWFELLMSKYLREETGRRAIRDFALRHYLSLRAQGVLTTMGALKRGFRRDLPSIVRRYFDTFFMIGTVAPGSRYSSLWHRIELEIARALRS